MPSPRPLLAAALLAAAPLAARPAALCAQAPAPEARLAATVDSIAAHTLAAWQVPGLSVAVLRGPHLLVARGYGLAHREARLPATEHTVWQLGSISKQFTAAAVVRLAEGRWLRLGDPVPRFVREYHPMGNAVQLHHLLRHTAGVREPFTLPEYGTLAADTTRSATELLERIVREPLGFAPDARWSYSNGNYTLLAHVVERSTGQPFESTLATELFRPLRLHSLRPCTPLPTTGHDARGYVLRDGHVAPAPPENMQWARGDGGLCGSAVDLVRWARALATGGVVRPASWTEMTRRTLLADGTTPDYGFGLSLVPLDGTHRRVSHGGRMAGFTATLAYYPDHDVAVAVLANRGGLWIEAVEQDIARAVLGLPRPVLQEVALPEPERRRYLGTYDLGVFAVEVVERDGALWLQAPAPAPTSRLVPLGNGAFALAEAPDALRARFHTWAPTGHTRRLELLMAGMRWYGERR